MKRLPLLSAFELKGKQDLVSVYDHAIVYFLLWGFGGVSGAFENVIFCVKVREVHGGRYSPYLATQSAVAVESAVYPISTCAFHFTFLIIR